MLIGYFDESGTQADSPAIAVAGALGPPEAWAYFEPRWQGLLAKYGVPTSHVTAYETRRAPFQDWSDARRLTQAVTWSRAHADGRVVSFIFEDGAQGKGEVQKMFEQAKADARWGRFLGTLKFRGKECLPLQAADIIVYEVWKQMVNQRVNGPVRDVRKSLYSILADLAFEDCYFDRDNLTQLVNTIAAKKCGAAEQADEADGALQ